MVGINWKKSALAAAVLAAGLTLPAADQVIDGGTLPTTWEAGSTYTFRNGTYTNGGDWNQNNGITIVLDEGCTFEQNHRHQLNNGHVRVLAGAKYLQKCDASANGSFYGAIVGLDQSGTYNTFKVEGGEVELNVNKMGTQAGGFQIACKGGSYYNTTGIVSIVSGKVTAATIMMTSRWEGTQLATGWHGGSHGELVQTGGELTTWKIFAGNTTAGEGGDTQAWRFTGGTGTIGSIRNGAFNDVDFLFDGYTVKAYENTERWFAYDGGTASGTQTFRIGANGLTVDTDGKTIGLDLSRWTVEGALTKTGTGTLRLDSDLATPVRLNAGELAVASARTVGALTLADGATLKVKTLAGGLTTLTASSVTVAADGTATLKIVGAAPANGTYPILIAPGLDLASFTLDTSALSGASATLKAVEGGLAVEVSGSDMPFAYRGASSETAWDAATGAWESASGTEVAWIDGAMARLASGTGVTVPEGKTIAVGALAFDNNGDFALLGTGTLAGTEDVVKRGTGTLTLNGANLTQQNVIIEAGKVVLGADAGATSLGDDSEKGGKVTIAAGGQFNINYTGTAGNNTEARAETTQLKTFVIAGDGPDGRGAIVNDALDGRTTHNAAWNAALRRVELAGDATIGGIDRFDVRTRNGTAATSVPGIYGPGHTLTVKATGYFGLVGQPIDVGAVRVADGGVFRPEAVGENAIKIPGGITLDNGTLHAYNQTFPASMPLTVTEKGGTVNAQSATSTFKGAVTVPEKSTLKFYNSDSTTVNVQGALANAGTLQFENSGLTVLKPSSMTGTMNATIVGGTARFSATSDWSATPFVFTQTGGTLGWGAGEAEGLPNASAENIDVSGITGGTVRFYTGKSETVPEAFRNATPGAFAFNTTAMDKVLTIPAGTWEMKTLSVSNPDAPANVVLASGADVTASSILMGDGGSKPQTSRLTVGEGASLTATSQVWVGHWSGENDATHEIVVDGGTFTFMGTDRIRMGWDAPKALFTVKSGTVNVYGLCCRKSWMDPTKYSEKFSLDGGTLNLGAGGLCAWTHFEPFVQLNAGTVNCTDNWVVEQLRTVAFGEKAGGHVDFDIADKTIDWRTGITGLADVTLKGSGTFKSGVGVKDYMRLQGAATGAWTIENTGANNLYGASAFLGGLHLAENTTANLRIGGSNLVSAVYLQSGSGSFASSYGWVKNLPFACNDLTFLHAKGGESDYSNATVQWQGQFYADTAGTWTFAGGYDDAVRIEIDGAKVLENTSWNTVVKGTTELTAGWHDFRIVQYQAGGGWGTVPAGWTGVMNVGFAKSELDNTTASNYLKFDNENLLLRAGPATAVGGSLNWSTAKYDGNTWNTDIDFTPQGTFSTLSQLHTYNVKLTPSISGSVHKFEGWVWVQGKQAGDWAVRLDYDDRASLRLDGVDSGAWGDNNETAKTGSFTGVQAGWHKFELRVADNAGNWGPWNDGKNFGKVTVNGVAYNLDETAFYFSPTKPAEYAGLDGEVQLDAGAKLANAATTACPIWGTLKGTGTLDGKFAFAGGANAWQMTGKGGVLKLAAVTLANADAAALANLRKVEIVFDRKPGRSLYEISPALGANAADIVLSVKDEKDNDYTEKCALEVQDGKLLLTNRCPSGVTVYVR